MDGLKKAISSSLIVTYVFFVASFYPLPKVLAQEPLDKKIQPRIYVPLSNNTMMKIESNSSQFLVKDYLNSTRLVEDDYSTRVDVGYYPYGQKKGTAFTPEEVFSDKVDKQYTGHRNLEDLSIYHSGSRFYSPVTSTFIQPDKTSPSNSYSYTSNNPITFNDPSGNCIFGLDTIVCVMVGLGALGAGIGTGYEKSNQIAEHGEVQDWGQVTASGLKGGVMGVGIGAGGYSLAGAGLAGVSTLGSTAAYLNSGASVTTAAKVACGQNNCAMAAGIIAEAVFDIGPASLIPSVDTSVNAQRLVLDQARSIRETQLAARIVPQLGAEMSQISQLARRNPLEPDMLAVTKDMLAGVDPTTPASLFRMSSLSGLLDGSNGMTRVRSLSGNGLADGTYLFVQRADGEIMLGVRSGGMKSPHSAMAGGEAAISAGHIRFRKGQVVSVDPFSGHYRPDNWRTSAVWDTLNQIGVKLTGPFMMKNGERGKNVTGPNSYFYAPWTDDK